MVERVRSKRHLLPAPKGQRESSIGADRAKFFGSVPLLAGENAADHNEFSQQVKAAVKPIDILDQIWVRDFVDYECDVSRLRRVKVKFFNDAAQNLLKDEILRCSVKEAEDAAGRPFEDDSDGILTEGDIETDRSDEDAEADRAANELAGRWIAGDQGAKSEMRKIFATAGRDVEEVIADVMEMAFLNTMKDVEVIDRMIMTAESRRNAAVREIDRHRAMLGLQLRRPSEQIHDAEFKVVEDEKAKREVA
jgi:hypothetical protein